MTEEGKETDFHFLKPVEALPIRKRERASFYDQIIDEFIESRLKYAMVKEMDKKPLSITYALRRILKKRGLKNIRVYQIKNQVYLKKLG